MTKITESIRNIFRKKERPRYFYDSSVFLGLLIEKDDLCKQCIHLIGYKNRSRGVVCHLVLGEILANIFLKLDDSGLRRDALNLIEEIFDKSLREERLEILKIEEKSNFYCEDLSDFQLEPSDKLILSEAILDRCSVFYTTDNKINNDKLRVYLKKKYNLIIRYP